VQKIQKLRVKVIDDIVNDDHIDKHYKLERLGFENDKINKMLHNHN
jgi:hypothetical protein